MTFFPRGQGEAERERFIALAFGLEAERLGLEAERFAIGLEPERLGLEAVRRLRTATFPPGTQRQTPLLAATLVQ